MLDFSKELLIVSHQLTCLASYQPAEPWIPDGRLSTPGAQQCAGRLHQSSEDLDSHLWIVMCFLEAHAFETAATMDFRLISRSRWERNCASSNLKQLRFHCSVPDQQLEKAGEHVVLWCFQNVVLGDFSVTKNVWSVGLLPQLGMKTVAENLRISVRNFNAFFLWSPRQDWDGCAVELSYGIIASSQPQGNSKMLRTRFSGLDSNWKSHCYYLGEKEYPVLHVPEMPCDFRFPDFYEVEK